MKISPPPPPRRWLKIVGWSSLFILATASCDKPKLTNPTSNAEEYTVSAIEARTVAANIDLHPLYATNPNKSNGPQRVTDVVAIPASDGQPAFYFCNYASKGFAVISADKHALPVLIYSGEGSLPTSGKSGLMQLPTGMLDWLGITQRAMVALHQSPRADNTVKGAPQLWQKLLNRPAEATNLNSVKGQDVSQVKEYDPCSDNQPPTQVGPLLQTAWGQGCGYNDLTPVANDGPCGHCPTGCVATSTAQIMYYWRSPSRFNWSGMAANYGTSYTAALMRDIGSGVDMEYRPNSSSAYDDKIAPQLKNRYGYQSAEFRDNQDLRYNGSIMSDLGRSQPVILGGFTDTSWFGFVPAGEGHSWVCDGYQTSSNCGYYYTAFHMNWGWNGSYNSWVLDNNWAVRDYSGTLHSFNYFRTVTLNIRP